MSDWIKKEMQALRDYMGKPSFGKTQDNVTIVFEDCGEPFDPTQKADPNIRLAGEERKLAVWAFIW